MPKDLDHGLWRAWWLPLLACCSCGRLWFDPLHDAGNTAETDGTEDAPSCASWGPFSAAMHVPSLSTVNNEFGTGISADNLAIVLDTDRTGVSSWDLFEATRTDASVPFGTPVQIQELTTVGSEDNPALSADGLTIYFSSDRLGQSSVWSATRTSRMQPFGSETQVVTPVAPLVSASTPSISADELTIYVTVTRATLDYNIAFATRSSTTEPFGALVEIPILSTTRMEANPSISADGLELFYQTNVAGSLDINVMRRATTSEPWGSEAVAVRTFVYQESDPTISYDGTTLWLAITGAKSEILGGGDIFYVTRTCL
jgi:Tol biopolymer transport system component